MEGRRSVPGRPCSLSTLYMSGRRMALVGMAAARAAAERVAGGAVERAVEATAVGAAAARAAAATAAGREVGRVVPWRSR